MHACTHALYTVHCQAWLSGLPAARVEADVRTSIAYLRADRQMRGAISLLGLGLGGGQVLRANAKELQLAAAVRPPHLAVALLPAPALALALTLALVHHPTTARHRPQARPLSSHAWST